MRSVMVTKMVGIVYPGNKPQGGEENAQQAKPNLRLCSARRGGINYHVSGPA